MSKVVAWFLDLVGIKGRNGTTIASDANPVPVQLPSTQNTVLQAIADNTANIKIDADSVNLNTDQLESKLDAIDAKLPALSGGKVPVIGPLTNGELRATPVNVNVAGMTIDELTVNFPSSVIDSANGLGTTLAPTVRNDGTWVDVSKYAGSTAFITASAAGQAFIEYSADGSTVVGQSQVASIPAGIGVSFGVSPSGVQYARRVYVQGASGGTVKIFVLHHSQAPGDSRSPVGTVTNDLYTGAIVMSHARGRHSSGAWFPIQVDPAGIQRVNTGLTQPTTPTDTQPVSGAFWQATQPVSGPLTDAQLRATAVPVSAASLPLPGGAATEATLALVKAKTDNLDVALSTRTKPSDQQHAIVDSSALPAGAATEATLAGIKTGTDKIPSSPSTDRTTAAAPFASRLSDGAAFYKATTPADTQPVSAASLPLPSGAATAANQQTNALTDAQLRATPVPVSGSVSTGGLTDAQLRASAVPVTANAGTNLNTSALALESGGNLASIKAKTDNIPAQGQALAAGSMPVVLTAAQVSALTPPAAITGFATETTLGLAKDSLSVLDDWDESDRAKVNPIVGQAGIEGGAGAATSKTTRVTLDTAQVTALTPLALGSISTVNSSSASLAASAAFSGTYEDISRFASNLVSCQMSQAGTLQFDFSQDGVTALLNPVVYTVAANTPIFMTPLPKARFFKVTLTNTSGSLATVALQVVYLNSSLGNFKTLLGNAGILRDSTVTDVVRAVLTGRYTTDTYGDILVDNANKLIVALGPSVTAGGTSTYKNSALLATKVQVKSSVGSIYGWTVYNPNVTVAYIQIFYLPSASVTVGTTSPDRILPVPAGGGLDTALAYAISAATGITVAATTTPTGNTAPATGLVFNMEYV